MARSWHCMLIVKKHLHFVSLAEDSATSKRFEPCTELYQKSILMAVEKPSWFLASTKSLLFVIIAIGQLRAGETCMDVPPSTSHQCLEIKAINYETFKLNLQAGDGTTPITTQVSGGCGSWVQLCCILISTNVNADLELCCRSYVR